MRPALITFAIGGIALLALFQIEWSPVERILIYFGIFAFLIVLALIGDVLERFGFINLGSYKRSISKCETVAEYDTAI